MPNKHALIVGIDSYRNLDPQYQLAGCVNDARLLSGVLAEHFGFRQDAITLLINEAASRAAIVAAMDRLVTDIERDDIVFFHFSGHGSRRTATTAEESSGKDSTIMPSDSGRDPLPNLDIVDDEINAWLQRLSEKTRSISLLFDCCHSGTITRDPFAAKIRSAPDDSRAVADMGLVDAGLAMTGVAEPSASATSQTGWLALSDAYVVMSGCRDDEYAHEFSEERGGEVIRNGALTHFLVSALIEAKPGSTYRDVFELAHARVNGKFASQNPQIEGAQDRELFGSRDIVPIRFVSVAAISDSAVSLAGGAAHGLQPGSRWAVYPPATKTVEGLSPLAVIEITRVDTLKASGKILSATVSNAIPVGARCVEIAPATEHFRVTVDVSDVPPTHQSALLEAIAQSPLLRAAANPEVADLRVRQMGMGMPEGARAAVLDGDMPAQAASNWSVLDRAGQLAMPPQAVNATDAVARLTENAESVARYQNALALDNPNSELRVEFALYKQAGDADWQKMAASGETLTAGDCIAFEVINHEERPLFLSVLDFGVSGKIQLLYPPDKTSELLLAGKTLRIGMGQRRIRLGLPAGFSGEVGSESFKVFITLSETDFSWLQQTGTRSLLGARTQLKRLFEAAYCGPTMRDAAMDDGDDNEDWRALTRSFGLRRA